MAEPWPVYVLPIDGDPKFMDVPQNNWNDRFNWRFGSCRRIIETPYVTEDREVQLLTFLRADDLKGRHSSDLPPVNRWVRELSPVAPILRGDVVLVSFLQGNGKEIPLNVRELYGLRGISDILRKPSRDLHRERIPCNMNYIRLKVAELQSMPEEE